MSHGTGSRFQPARCMTRAIAATLFVATALGCVGAPSSDSNFDSSTVLLHLDYRTGGDAPLGLLLTFMDGGRVRYHSPNRRTHWANLSTPDQKRFLELVGSPKFREDIAQMERDAQHSFACCDSHELGIYTSVDAIPVAVRFQEPELVPGSVEALVRLVNRIGHKYFGRRYRLSLPEIGGLDRQSSSRLLDKSVRPVLSWPIACVNARQAAASPAEPGIPSS